MRNRAAGIVAATVLATVLGGVAAPLAGLGACAGTQPLLLRITGFVGAARPGTLSLGTFTLGVDHKVLTLDLTAVQTLNGPLTEGPDALRQFDLYSPNLLVVGHRNVLRSLTEATLHTQITLFGYVHQGARRMFVVEVQSA